MQRAISARHCPATPLQRICREPPALASQGALPRSFWTDIEVVGRSTTVFRCFAGRSSVDLQPSSDVLRALWTGSSDHTCTYGRRRSHPHGR